MKKNIVYKRVPSALINQANPTKRGLGVRAVRNTTIVFILMSFRLSWLYIEFEMTSMHCAKCIYSIFPWIRWKTSRSELIPVVFLFWRIMCDDMMDHHLMCVMCVKLMGAQKPKYPKPDENLEWCGILLCQVSVVITKKRNLDVVMLWVDVWCMFWNGHYVM